MQILDNFEMPVGVSTSNGRGSKYYTAEAQELLEKLKPQQGFILPTLADTDVKTHYRQFKWYFEKAYKGSNKRFQLAACKDGIAIKRIADVEAANVEAANVEAANVEAANVEAANVEAADPK